MNKITIDKKHAAYQVVALLASITKNEDAPKYRHAYSVDGKLVATDQKRLLELEQEKFKMFLDPGYYKITKSGSDYIIEAAVVEGSYPDYKRVIPAGNTITEDIKHDNFSCFYCKLVRVPSYELILNVDYIEPWFKIPLYQSTASYMEKYSFPVLLSAEGLRYVVMPMTSY